MATETLACSATSTPNNWLIGAGASKVAAVASPDDDATSYIISSSFSGRQQRFAVADPTTIGPSDSITNVAIRARCRSGSTLTADYKVTAVLSAATSDGATRTAPANTSSYATTLDNFPSKPGGGSWTLADIQALEVQIENTQARSVDCTTLEVIVTFTSGSPQTVVPGVALVNVTAHSPVPVPGPWSATAGVATVNVTAHPPTPVPGPVSRAAGVAEVNVEAFSAGVSVGPVSRSAGVANVSVTAIAASVTTGGVSSVVVEPGVALVTVQAFPATARTGDGGNFQDPPIVVPPPPPPDDPVPPTVPLPQYRHVMLPEFVSVSFPRVGTDPDDAQCEGATPVKVPLGIFDFSKPDAVRAGINYATLKLAEPYGGFPDGAASQVPPPLHPYFAEMSAMVATNFRIGQRGRDPDDNETAKARDLAIQVAKDHYGWRLAGSDDYYAGTPYYLFDAHDDTILFDYSASGVGMRVCPVPAGYGDPSSVLNASGLNCWREIERFYIGPACEYVVERSDGDGGTITDTYIIKRWQERPLYADGRFGQVCKEWYDCDLVRDICPESAICVVLASPACPEGLPVSGIPFILYKHDGSDEESSGDGCHVGTPAFFGTTDVDGRFCFSANDYELVPGDYRLRVEVCPGFAYTNCNLPSFFDNCQTVNVGINTEWFEDCVQVIDYDTGARVDGIVLGGGYRSNPCGCYPELTGPTSQECVWNTGVGGRAVLNQRVAGEFELPFAGVWGPGIGLTPDGQWWVAGGTSACDSPCRCRKRNGKVVVYDRKKYTKLNCYRCRVRPSCDASSRDPEMIPRLLYARISGPGPLCGGGGTYPLRYKSGDGTRTSPGGFSLQIWDSGPLPGLGRYNCDTFYLQPGNFFPRAWCVGPTEEKQFAATRIWLTVQCQFSGSNSGAMRASLNIRNYYTFEACQAENFRTGGDVCSWRFETPSWSPGGGFDQGTGLPGECWDPRPIDIGQAQFGRNYKQPGGIPLPGSYVDVFGDTNFCGPRTLSGCPPYPPIPARTRYLGEVYPSRVSSANFGYKWEAVPTQSCVTESRNRPMCVQGGWWRNSIPAPINYGGSLIYEPFQQFGTGGTPCQWIFTYELFE